MWGVWAVGDDPEAVGEWDDGTGATFSFEVESGEVWVDA